MTHVVHPASEALPDLIQNEAELDEFLTRPRAALLQTIRQLQNPLVVLGAGGKMGPSLAVLAKRAADAAGHRLEVIAVSRFLDAHSKRWLETRGVRTHSADLLKRNEVVGLPESANVIFLVGLKFGTSQNPSLTWAVNTVVPALVMERYPRAKLVALSTGNVYPLVSSAGQAPTEAHSLTPLGEYANAAVARERIFEYFSQRDETPVAILRLNYATELRYGVLVDIARRISRQEPIELANGWFNCIWQRDANEMILRSLSLAKSPAEAWNLTSPRKYSVREAAERLGELLGVTPRFTGNEGATALLSDSSKLCAVLGEPLTPLEAIFRWTAHWVKIGRRSLDKPTHFEVRDGRY
jgi:nucleoside-diphosphate-sugar epimerase